MLKAAKKTANLEILCMLILRIICFQEDSEQLLQQTEEAQKAGLKFGKIYDLYPAIQAAQNGSVLSIRQLNGVAVTLEAALELRSQLKMSGESKSQSPPSTNGLPLHPVPA